MYNNKIITMEKLKYRTVIYWMGESMQRLAMSFDPINSQLTMLLSDDVGFHDDGGNPNEKGYYVGMIEEVLKTGKPLLTGYGNIARLEIYPDYTNVEILSHEGEFMRVPTHKLLEIVKIWNGECKKYRQDPKNYEPISGEL